jgi:hypothetical protein
MARDPHLGEATETRGMAEQGQQGQREAVDVSNRTFAVLLLVILVVLGGLAVYLRYVR